MFGTMKHQGSFYFGTSAFCYHVVNVGKATIHLNMAAVGHGNIPSRNSSKLSSSSTLWSSVEIEAFFPAKNNLKKM